MLQTNRESCDVEQKDMVPEFFTIRKDRQLASSRGKCPDASAFGND